MAAAELSPMNCTSSGSPVLWPPSRVSVTNSSLLSSMFCSFWNLVSEAFMPLEEKLVLPPFTAIFSSTTTLVRPAS